MIASIFCCSCHREQFIRFKKGLEYRIISIGEGDSTFKKGIPPFAKKGEWLYTCLKVVDIFGVKQDFRDDLRKEMEKKRREYEQATN